MEKSITELLVRPQIAFETIPGHYTGETKFRTGLCDTHKRSVAASNHVEDYNVTLSNVAVLFDYVKDGQLSCAGSSDRVYLEFRDKGGNTVWCYAEMDGEYPQVYDKAPDTIYATAALAVLAILTVPVIRKSYMDVIAAMQDANVDYDKLTTGIYHFCDSFLYDFAKPARSVYQTKDTLTEEELLLAYRSRLLNDMSNQFSMAKNAEPCRLFRGIAQKEEPKKAVKKQKDNMKSFRNMEHHVDYKWKDEQKDRIRPVSFLDDFTPTDTFYKVMKKIDLRIGKNMVTNLQCGVTDPLMIRSDYVNMLFYGDPGTGKTALANAISASTGMPIYEVTFNEDSEEDEFEGKNKIVEGKLSFVETAFLEGFANGGILLLEEINLARANIFTSVLNQAMEYPYIIKRNGYERIVRHPLTVIIGTMNLETEGTTSLNSACSQRFTSKYLVGEMGDKDMMESLRKRGYSTDDIRYVYGQYKKLRKSLKETDQERKLLREVSIRQCIDALNAIEEGVEPREAVIDSLYGALAVKNKRVADKYMAGMFQAMVNYTKTT